MSSINKACIICASSSLKQLGAYYERHSLVKCANCGFIFTEKIPSKELLDEHYSKYSYARETYLSPITILSYHKLLDELEPYKSNGRLLDVGCGRGWFLIEAKKRGWEVYGSEYSTTAVELCKKEGIKMHEGPLDLEAFPPDFFDVITSFEVIEHINNPQEEISFIKHFLRKGGLFYCTTPNFNSALRYYLKENYNVLGYPEHLSYYTRTTLSNLINANGFKRVKFLTTGISITRLKTSIKPNSEKIIAKENSDEKLRELINGKWYMELAKTLVNRMLTVFGLGMTLKGYFIKK